MSTISSSLKRNAKLKNKRKDKPPYPTNSRVVRTLEGGRGTTEGDPLAPMPTSYEQEKHMFGYPLARPTAHTSLGKPLDVIVVPRVELPPLTSRVHTKDRPPTVETGGGHNHSITYEISDKSHAQILEDSAYQTLEAKIEPLYHEPVVNRPDHHVKQRRRPRLKTIFMPLALQYIKDLRPPHRGVIPKNEYLALSNTLYNTFSAPQLEEYCAECDKDNPPLPSEYTSYDWVWSADLWIPFQEQSATYARSEFKKMVLITTILRRHWGLEVDELANGRGILRFRLYDNHCFRRFLCSSLTRGLPPLLSLCPSC